MTRLVVIGAGIGGLVAASEAARQGFDVTLIEKEPQVGGKIRTLNVNGHDIDAGPTVFTMKPVFDALFATAGLALDDFIQCEKLDILARHFWPDGSHLDLFSDRQKSIEAVARFAGGDEALAFERFSAEAHSLYELLKDNFIFSERKSTFGMIQALGPSGLAALFNLGPFATLSQKLKRSFKDPRLQQLFGRYATYSGGSPYQSPATLMLIADVEMQGVWHIQGGMIELAKALEALAHRQGVDIVCGETVRRIHVSGDKVDHIELMSGQMLPCDALVFNGDVSALAQGLFGPAVETAGLNVPAPERSLSAMTWCSHGPWMGPLLSHHNVFFDDDYKSEFDDVFTHRTLPKRPTLYVCAQDRGSQAAALSHERLFMLINAPADGDHADLPAADIARAESAIAVHLARFGMSLEGSVITRTTPKDFNALFPGTGGALYGQAPHGWVRSVSRGDARTSIKGLYRCGGSVHPGAGVPLAALSGLKAVSALQADYASISPSRPMAISGGILTRSVQTEPMA